MSSRSIESNRPDRICHLCQGDTVYYQQNPATIANVYKRGKQWMLSLIIKTDMGPRQVEVSTHASNLQIPRSASML